MTPRPMRFDFVSDIVCPWCAIGLAGLDKALEAVGDLIAPDLRFYPLELNPGLPAEGESIAANIARKYGVTPEQARERGGAMRAVAAEVGVSMAGRTDRIFDTFDAHRLLHWAAIEGKQLALKRALLAAYFETGRNVSDSDVMIETATAAGLDRSAARAVLAEDRFADDVRAAEAYWRSEGVTSVPTIVIDGKYVIAGAQTPDRYERAIRRIAA